MLDNEEGTNNMESELELEAEARGERTHVGTVMLEGDNARRL
jgi:hypothetical protein